MKLPETAARWLKFNAVGALGIAVQLAVLAALRAAALHYLGATALAVEAAVLHNFVWHERWTWRDRAGPGLGRLVRFHLTNGLVSIGGNLLFMRLLVGWLGLPVLPSSLGSIAACSVLNFLASDRLVFTEGRYPRTRSTPGGSLRVKCSSEMSTLKRSRSNSIRVSFWLDSMKACFKGNHHSRSTQRSTCR